MYIQHDNLSETRKFFIVNNTSIAFNGEFNSRKRFKKIRIKNKPKAKR